MEHTERCDATRGRGTRQQLWNIVRSLAVPGSSAITIAVRLLGELEALSDLGFDKERSTLVTLVGVLLEDGGVVFLRLLAAFQNDRYE